MDNIDLRNIFVCPQCGGEIEFSSELWKCLNCSMQWRVDEYGIVHFTENNVFFGSDQAGMNSLLNEMQKMSREVFFNNIGRLEEAYEDFDYDYCLNSARADWTILGNFKDKVVVDLGCGYGTLSVPLALSARAVIAVDICEERLKFLSIIAGLRGINNIWFVHTDAFKLALRKSTIDAIILFGLLEYAGAWNLEKKGKRFPIELLSHIHSFLNQGGQLWIGTGNILNPQYLLGLTENYDLPFTPSRSMSIADILTGAVRRSRYISHIYTKWGYRRILRSSGYRDINIHYIFYDFKSLKLLIPDDRSRLLYRYITESGMDTVKESLKYNIALKIIKLLDWLGLYGVFGPAFIIKANRDVVTPI